jgi:hypothetical protein
MLSERRRRAELLCCDTLLNIVYFRVGFEMHGQSNDPVLISILTNFMHMAYLDWCKLFGDAGGIQRKRMQQHSWRRIVRNASEFEVGLLETLSIGREQFEVLRLAVRTHRDTFVAHRDNSSSFVLPQLEHLKVSAAYYLDHLHPAVQPLAELYCRQRKIEAVAFYRRLA